MTLSAEKDTYHRCVVCCPLMLCVFTMLSTWIYFVFILSHKTVLRHAFSAIP